MPHLATYVALADRTERTLADSLRTVSEGHAKYPDVFFTCQTLAQMSDHHIEWLGPTVQRYGEQSADQHLDEPERLHAAGLAEVRSGPVGLLRDLQDLLVLATLVQTTWTVIGQAAQGMRDEELLAVARKATSQTTRQVAWLNTRMKVAAPQALIVDP